MRHTRITQEDSGQVIDRRAAAIFVLVAASILGLPGSSAGAARRAVAVSHGPRTRPDVALTFDDGANPENCRRILAELVAAGVPATFFPIAAAMPLDPAFWRLVVAAGDPIGDHTLTHPQMPTLTPAEQLGQLEDSRAVIESITGRPPLDVFRPPYGAFDGGTLVAAAAAGFPTLLTWDTTDRDTSLHGTLEQRVAAAELGTNGSVILLHCGPNATPYLVPDVIDFYRSRGFRLVSVPTLLGITWDPGTVSVPSAATILGSLAPLPPTWQGGDIVGAAGYTPPPSPSAGAASPSALPSSLPAASPSPEGTVAESASPMPTAMASSPATPAPSAAGQTRSVDGGMATRRRPRS
ncbi:MAG: polysaccharide deacetylase family protein [Chloroflexi bacterium]|nr:polysaccharide deacetylase family protein [Chloroflexota bacterium]